MLDHKFANSCSSWLRRVSREHPRTDRISVKGLRVEHTLEVLVHTIVHPCGTQAQLQVLEQYFSEFGNIIRVKDSLTLLMTLPTLV